MDLIFLLLAGAFWLLAVALALGCQRLLNRGARP